jgi:hypothetical protein
VAQRHLREILSSAPEVARDFDTVFAHSGPYLFRWRDGELDFHY